MLTIALALALSIHAAEPPTVSPPQEETGSVVTDLLQLASSFHGKDTTQAIATALQQGAALKTTDMKGNTPLLLLASTLEKNSLYTSDESFRQALREAITLLLQNGADALAENNAGCNAVFFLHSDPQFMLELSRLKLIPKELAIRIPHEDSALSRYMQLRIAQAGYSTNPFCLDYLKRRYCKPAYSRVRERLELFLAAETSSHIPVGAMQDTLAFLRMADEKSITDFVNKLPLWEHGEHFLEEIPERLLVALCELQWEVETDNLKKALRKLESMLPVEEGDMIDCYAAYPMGQILEMLSRQDAAATTELLQQYTASPDPDMAYTAYKLLLQQQKLPLPEPGPLCEKLNLSGGIDALPPEQKKLLECTIVDEAMRKDNIQNISPAMAERVCNYFREMKLDAYADIVDSVLGENRIITPEEGLYEACSTYREGRTAPPRLILARFILEHPDIFVTETP